MISPVCPWPIPIIVGKRANVLLAGRVEPPPWNRWKFWLILGVLAPLCCSFLSEHSLLYLVYLFGARPGVQACHY
ncbi:unnamed protein product [Prunus armeniaca]